MLPSSRGQGRHTQDVTLSLPQRLVSEDEERKQCFGGFFGQIDLLHQVKEAGKVRTNEENRSLLVYAVEDKLRLLKAGALDGGFRYTNLDLQLANPTKPREKTTIGMGSEEPAEFGLVPTSGSFLLPVYCVVIQSDQVSALLWRHCINNQSYDRTQSHNQ
ncbi:hypothetical protein EB796_005643 [Bugula neritina]|uniref:Uncharacterized protein n=1 Tax=Bugula neritina TaxID=10212 RepID=A0A7J7KEJ2_BUGNE|nr:hypothetical protein EB796_005643 [Bugula neritina]